MEVNHRLWAKKVKVLYFHSDFGSYFIKYIFFKLIFLCISLLWYFSCYLMVITLMYFGQKPHTHTRTNGVLFLEAVVMNLGVVSFAI